MLLANKSFSLYKVKDLSKYIHVKQKSWSLKYSFQEQPFLIDWQVEKSPLERKLMQYEYPTKKLTTILRP